MKNLNITIKFFLPAAFFFITLSVLLAFFVNNNIETLLIDRTKSLIANFTESHAVYMLNPNDFSFENPEKTKLIFSDFSEKIIKTAEVARIKVWDKEGRIIFSDDKSIVGKYFKDNEEYKEAMKGNTAIEISELTKNENQEEKEYGKLMEVYVPIIFQNGAEPSGVIETYYKFDAVSKIIRSAQIKILGAAAIMIFIFFLFFLFSFKILIKNPLFKLNTVVKKISEGNLNIKANVFSNDEIGELSKSFNEMTNKLKNNQEELRKINNELESRVKEKLGPYDEKIKKLEEEIYNLEKTRNNLEIKLKEFL